MKKKGIHNLSSEKAALVIVDMQKYYLSHESSYYRFFSKQYHGCMDYISKRCNELVISNIKKLYEFFLQENANIIFLKLCGKDPLRRDLHKAFSTVWLIGKTEGYADVYPLESEPDADIIDELAPQKNNAKITIINKTTYSPFTFTNIDDILQERGIKKLVFTGLATSQCVETSARDAADREYEVVQIEDAQADYTEENHIASIYSSQGVCGGNLYTTDGFIELYRK